MILNQLSAAASSLSSSRYLPLPNVISPYKQYVESNNMNSTQFSVHTSSLSHYYSPSPHYPYSHNYPQNQFHDNHSFNIGSPIEPFPMRSPKKCKNLI